MSKDTSATSQTSNIHNKLGGLSDLNYAKKGAASHGDDEGHNGVATTVSPASPGANNNGLTPSSVSNSTESSPNSSALSSSSADSNKKVTCKSPPLDSDTLACLV